MSTILDPKKVMWGGEKKNIKIPKNRPVIHNGNLGLVIELIEGRERREVILVLVAVNLDRIWAGDWLGQIRVEVDILVFRDLGNIQRHSNIERTLALDDCEEVGGIFLLLGDIWGRIVFFETFQELRYLQPLAPDLSISQLFQLLEEYFVTRSHILSKPLYRY